MFSLCRHTIFPLHVPASVQISHFNKDTSRAGLGPTLITSCDLDFLCKDPILNKGTF